MGLRFGHKTKEVGDVPEEWTVVTVGSAGQVLGGRQRSPHYHGRLTSYLRVANVLDDAIDTTDVKVMPFSADERERFRLDDGDILLNEGQSIDLVGRSAIYRGVPPECCFQNTLLRFRAGVATDTRFAQQMFRRYLQTGVFASVALQTTSIAHLGASRFAGLLITLPPLPEQRAIGEALGDVDVLLGTVEAVLAKKRDLKQAAMQQLLTGQTRLPGFRGEWEVKVLGELFKFSGGYSASRDQLSTDGYCYLHYGDIHKSSSTFIDVRAEYQNIPMLDIPLKRVSAKSFLEDGDVVFVDASEDDEGASKHVVIVNKDRVPFISGLHTIVAKSKTHELSHQYRRFCFQTAAIRSGFLFYAVGTKVSGISKTNIAKLTLPIPSVSEQTAIAEILSDMDAEISALEARRDKTRALKQAMMQELLTGRTRLV